MCYTVFFIDSHALLRGIEEEALFVAAVVYGMELALALVVCVCF